MNAMTYKNYTAKIEFSDEDECFIGHLVGINDIIGFHGDSVMALKEAFAEAVEDYLDACARINKDPQKPYSGNLMLRVPPQVHAAVATAAQVQGKSINQWATEILLKGASPVV